MTTRNQDRQPRPSAMKESGLLQRARRFLRDAFPDAVPHLVVGYSGGQDSLALLLVLLELRRLRKCELTVVHVDHGLRPESGEDADRAVEVGRELGVDVVRKTAEGSLRKVYPGQSVEDIARRFRYQSLTRVLNDVGGDAIVAGHHRRDQAEMVLLHLLRGSGLAGLRGMVPDSMLAVTWMQKPGFGPATMVRVIRPFLHEAPEALGEIVAQAGVPVIEDPTNASPEFRRNRIRHELLPLMEEIAPGATGRLVSLADLAQEDEVALSEVSVSLLERSLDGETLLWKGLLDAPHGLRRRVVRHWLLGFSEVEDLSRERVDTVIELASRNESGKQVEIGGGWRVRYEKGRLDMVPPGRSK